MKTKFVSTMDTMHKVIKATIKRLELDDKGLPSISIEEVEPQITGVYGFETSEVEAGISTVWFYLWQGGLVQGYTNVVVNDSAFISPIYGTKQTVGQFVAKYYGALSGAGGFISPYYGYATSITLSSSSS